MTTPSGILVTAEQEKKKKRIIPKVVAYLSLLRWSHARTDQFWLVNTPLVDQYQAPYLKQELAPADPHKMNTVENSWFISF